jgi:hypothetical protein
LASEEMKKIENFLQNIIMKYLKIISDGSCHEGCLTKKFESDREANHGKSVFEAR